MADIRNYKDRFADDRAFTRFLVEEIGVAVVPGSSFFSKPEYGADWIRFCFPKKKETLDAAEERLARLSA